MACDGFSLFRGTRPARGHPAQTPLGHPGQRRRVLGPRLRGGRQERIGQVPENAERACFGFGGTSRLRVVFFWFPDIASFSFFRMSLFLL